MKKKQKARSGKHEAGSGKREAREKTNDRWTIKKPETWNLEPET
jgi:hypothetical protein